MASRQTSSLNRDSIIAFLFSIPISFLGGLIGLGGAEFRLPVLVAILKRQIRDAVPINLAISLVTLLVSLTTRIFVAPDFPIAEILPILLSMIFGAMVASFLTAGLATKISNRALERWVKVLLISIGILLIAEGFIPTVNAQLLNNALLVQIIAGVITGGLIGFVSSMLGVAGGELIIPTLIFLFGVGIKLAGTSSLIISIPTVLTGLIRYSRTRKLFDQQSLKNIILPMSVGSIIGSIIGGLLFGAINPNVLKVVLGSVLIFSAIRMFFNRKNDQSS